MSSLDANVAGLIRPYRPSDRTDLLRIAADTAFFGEPVERYMEDRRIFNDFFYAYYTDVEPAYCWIAEADGRVAGFLAGCLDTRARAGRFVRYILPGLLQSLARGKYRFGPLTRNYLSRWAVAVLRSEIPHVDLSTYPAHLHINVDETVRGHGFGRRLMNTFLHQLQELQVPGVHLETTSLNVAACRLYESVGFILLDARLTHMWSGMVDEPVENRCYGLLLAEARLGSG
jgi:ribosomal protein S18 acetylase RimI-like enzyme